MPKVALTVVPNMSVSELLRGHPLGHEQAGQLERHLVSTMHLVVPVRLSISTRRCATGGNV
eukprot:7384257-Pyramimonas_sp.AAC.1